MTASDRSSYAPRIRAARAYARLTQQELAAQLGVDVQTVKRREKGSHPPRRAELLAIAEVTGVPAEFLEHGFSTSSNDRG
jgi:transcriptional regulator with XRE-family HTH domain